MKTQITKQQAIENVKNSISSIFSKEDVINLLNSIGEENNNEISSVLEEVKNRVLSEIRNLSSSDIVDFDSAELEMDYNRTVNLQNIDLMTDSLESDIEEIFDNAIGETEEKEEEEVES